MTFEMDMLTQVRLGDTVLYQNRDGRVMAAIVTANELTPDYPAAPGTVTLTVLSPHCGPYIKHSVQPGNEPQTFTTR